MRKDASFFLPLFVHTKAAPFGAKGADRAEMVLVDEKELLSSMGLDKVEPWWQPYSLQMILKLLASSLMVCMA